MSTNHFYHTQGIRGYKLKKLERVGGVEIACNLTAKKPRSRRERATVARLRRNCG